MIESILYHFDPNALCSPVRKSFSIKLSIKPCADILLSSLRCAFLLLISKRCFQRGFEIAQLHGDAVSLFSLCVHVEAGFLHLYLTPYSSFPPLTPLGCSYRFISSVTEEISHRLPTSEYILIWKESLCYTLDPHAHFVALKEKEEKMY